MTPTKSTTPSPTFASRSFTTTLKYHQGPRKTHTLLFNDVMCAKSPVQCCDNGDAPTPRHQRTTTPGHFMRNVVITLHLPAIIFSFYIYCYNYSYFHYYYSHHYHFNYYHYYIKHFSNYYLMLMYSVTCDCNTFSVAFHLFISTRRGINKEG